MTDQPGLSAEFPTASPWPLFVALGFALSEVGVFLGIFPVAVAGLLLFGTSLTGILRESGYVSRTWRLLGGIGALFALVGAGVVATQADVGLDALTGIVRNPGGIAGRGLAVAVAGLALLAAGITGRVFEPSDR